MEEKLKALKLENAELKVEREFLCQYEKKKVNCNRFETREQTLRELFEYIELLYNRIRLQEVWVSQPI